MSASRRKAKFRPAGVTAETVAGAPDRQARVIRALLIFSGLLFVSMIGLILWLKHNEKIAAQQDAAIAKMTSYVMDEAHLIAPDERARLNERLRAVYRADGPQIVVATIARVTQGSIAQDALARARAWRIGHAGRNDGVLLLIAAEERKARIEVGYGLEGVLTDAASRLVIANRMERHLQAREWTEAARGGVEGVLDIVGATVVAPNAGRPAPAEPLWWTLLAGLGKAIVVVFFAVVFLLFFVAIVMVALSILQTILLAVPYVGPRIRTSNRWNWLAKPLPVKWEKGGSSGSGSSSDSGSSGSSSSSSSSDSDSGGGGDFGGGGSND
ncbi:MAG: TPM domain-containing protein [Rhodoblastus sp.]